MTKQRIRTRVRTITCPGCSIEMYSRAVHDYHGCKCGTAVDGGFDYLKFGWGLNMPKPKIRVRYINATKQELYDDWATSTHKFGFIKR